MGDLLGRLVRLFDRHHDRCLEPPVAAGPVITQPLVGGAADRDRQRRMAHALAAAAEGAQHGVLDVQRVEVLVAQQVEIAARHAAVCRPGIDAMRIRHRLGIAERRSDATAEALQHLPMLFGQPRSEVGNAPDRGVDIDVDNLLRDARFIGRRRTFGLGRIETHCILP